MHCLETTASRYRRGGNQCTLLSNFDQHEGLQMASCFVKQGSSFKAFWQPPIHGICADAKAPGKKTKVDWYYEAGKESHADHKL